TEQDPARGSRYRGAGTRPPWMVPGARSSGDSVPEQRNKNPGHASDRTAGPPRPRWPARWEQATIYLDSRQSLQSFNTPVHLSFNFVISPGQKFSKCPNVSEFETGPSRPARHPGRQQAVSRIVAIPVVELMGRE